MIDKQQAREETVMETYEIDDSGRTPERIPGTRRKRVRGYAVGCFGLRRCMGWWRIDHIPTGMKLPYDYEEADVAAFVCLELLCRADWAFTEAPTKARFAKLSSIFRSVESLRRGLGGSQRW